MLLRDAKPRCSCLELFFVGEMQQKQAIWCIKCKSLDINLLFIELLYKINITFVIMLIFEEKTALFVWFYLTPSPRRLMYACTP